VNPEVSATESSGDSASGGVDLEHLTELVYALLQAEIRLGLARGETLPRARRSA